MNQTIRFNQINKLITFGLPFALIDFKRFVEEELGLNWLVFSSERHLKEDWQGGSLKEFLERNQITFYQSVDINQEPGLPAEIDKHTLGIAMGAAWLFEKATVNLFSPNHFVEFMNIDLPRYRGGAHHTWRILHQNRKGCLNIQLVYGGKDTFHRGPILQRKHFTFPENLKRPIDFYRSAAGQELAFLKDFLEKAVSGGEFSLSGLDEKQSSYYPFLASKAQGLIDWSWSGKDIYLLINAFGQPYSGAVSFWNGQKVFLKDCSLLPQEESYHPFTAGLVVRKDEAALYLASLGQLLKIETVLDSQGRSIKERVSLGDRFYTSRSEIDKALAFKAVYNAAGLKSQPKN